MSDEQDTRWLSDPKAVYVFVRLWMIAKESKARFALRSFARQLDVCVNTLTSALSVLRLCGVLDITPSRGRGGGIEVVLNVSLNDTLTLNVSSNDTLNDLNVSSNDTLDPINVSSNDTFSAKNDPIPYYKNTSIYTNKRINRTHARTSARTHEGESEEARPAESASNVSYQAPITALTADELTTLLTSDRYADMLQLKCHADLESLKSYFAEFASDLRGQNKPHNSETDVVYHFINWYQKKVSYLTKMSNEPNIKTNSGGDNPKGSGWSSGRSGIDSTAYDIGRRNAEILKSAMASLGRNT